MYSDQLNKTITNLMDSRKRPAIPLISCVVPAYNEAENLVILIPELTKTLTGLSSEYEIIVVDDGSYDQTSTVAISLSTAHPVSLVQLSRNFGKEQALSAGLDYARGDVVILMDADLQHPLDLLPCFMEYWRKGYDSVYGIRSDRDDENILKRSATALFYKLINRGSKTIIEPDAGDFRLLDASVVKVLRSLPERNRMMKGLYAWVGFIGIGVPFKVAARRKGKSHYSIGLLSKLALSGLTSFTDMPLRMWAIIGASISLLSISYGIFETIRNFLFGVDVPGWTTLVVGITFLGGIQLLSIGILGEYIARIYTEVKARPLYVVSHYHNHRQDREPR